MASNFEYVSDPQHDRDIIAALTEIGRALRPDTSETLLRAYVTSDVAEEAQPIDSIREDSVLAKAAKSEHYFLKQTELLIRKFVQVLVSRQSTGLLDVRVQYVNPNPTPIEFANALEIAQRHLPPSGLATRLKAEMGGAFSEHYAEREKALTRLEYVADRIVEQLELNARQQREEWSKRKDDLEQNYDERRQALEEENAKRAASLAERERVAQERLQQIDDRDNRHARRDIYLKIKDALRERSTEFVLSRGTNQKRWPITVAFLISAVASGYASMRTWHEWDIAHSVAQSLERGFDVEREDLYGRVGDPSEIKELIIQQRESEIPRREAAASLKWELSVRAILASIAFFGTIFGYGRWQQSWLARHADEEFLAKRLEIDVDRASWVVELALEYEESTDEPLPDYLMEVLTKGLFDPAGRSHQMMHPLEEAVGSIVGAAKEAEVNLPGFKAKLDRRSMRKGRQTKAEG